MATQQHITQVGQIARCVSDIDAARRWYSDVLGLAHLYSFGQLAFFECAGMRLLLSQEADHSPQNAIIYFSVVDLDTAYRDYLGRGIEFSSAPHIIHRHEDGTEEWMAFFFDNERQPLALMSKRKAGTTPIG